MDDVIKQLPKITHDDSLIILKMAMDRLNKLPYQHVFQAVVYISGQKLTTMFNISEITNYIQDSTNSSIQANGSSFQNRGGFTKKILKKAFGINY